MKIRNKRRLFTFTLALFVLCSVFVVTAFAWRSSPVGAPYYVLLQTQEQKDENSTEFCAIGWFEADYQPIAPGSGLNFAYDSDIIRSVDMVSNLLVVYDNTATSPNSSLHITNYNTQVIGPLADYIADNSFYVDGLLDGISSASGVPKDDLELTYNEGFSKGEEKGYIEGFSNGQSRGYTEGVAEGEVASNFLLTLFSAPTYILSTIFNFEIFGINIYLLITFLLTIVIVGFVLKKIL